MVDFAEISIEELGRILEEFPWFTIARKEYVRRHSKLGDEALDEAASEAGIFFLSRKEFLQELRRKDEPQAKHGADGRSGAAQETKPSYYIVGGDYFGKEDFSQLEKSGNAFDIAGLKYNPIASTIGTMDVVKTENRTEPKPFEPEEPCTETLARIYFDQQLYDRAIELYEKLILLYPEKNTYFANLIQEVKKAKQI